MFTVEHKDEFEMLAMYEDNHPLLGFRKTIMHTLKKCSWVCFYVIKHKFFETIVLNIILLNTVTLMMNDPKATTTSSV